MWSFARTCMKELASVALVAGALVFAAAAPGQAQGMIGHGSRPETSAGQQHVSDEHRPDGSNGHHDHERDRDHLFRRGVYWRYPYYFSYYPYYYYEAPRYWYYCPSYEAYYPYVSGCPESWVLVPAS